MLPSVVTKSSLNFNIKNKLMMKKKEAISALLFTKFVLFSKKIPNLRPKIEYNLRKLINYCFFVYVL